MDAWSELEASIRTLLTILSAAPPQTAFSIAAAIPDVGRLQELLLALGDIQLEEPVDLKELKEICSYFLLSSKYRNSIVHGQWLLTNNRMPPPFGLFPQFVWVRTYTIIDKTKEFMAVIGTDEKTAKRHVFTVDRLNERAEKARKFVERVKEFSERIRGRVRFHNRGT